MNKNNDEEWVIIAKQFNKYRKKSIKKQIKELESNNQKQQFELYASNWEKQNCNCIIEKKEVVKMTKKECLNALNYLDDTAYIDFRRQSVQYKILKYLINEHFDNSPLTFRNLKIGEPYWDSKEKEWCYFVTLHKELKTGVKISISKTPLMGAFRFEQNRFYRKKVQDE